MVTPPTGRSAGQPRKDDIRFRPEGYIRGFAAHRMRQGKTEHAAIKSAIEEVEGKPRIDIENRYRTIHKLGKTRSPIERRWFDLVADAVSLAQSDCADEFLVAATTLVDTAAETKFGSFRLGEGRRLGQLNKQPGWLLQKLRGMRQR